MVGEVKYSTGEGVRTVASDGRFEWRRMTGKRVYVFFRSDTVRSNRIVLR